MIWSQLFDADYIDPEFIIKSDQLDDYYSMNKSRENIKSNKLKYLYNKNNIKKEFINTGFNTPELYLYTQNEISLTDLSKYNTLNNLVTKEKTEISNKIQFCEEHLSYKLVPNDVVKHILFNYF